MLEYTSIAYGDTVMRETIISKLQNRSATVQGYSSTRYISGATIQARSAGGYQARSNSLSEYHPAIGSYTSRPTIAFARNSLDGNGYIHRSVEIQGRTYDTIGFTQTRRKKQPEKKLLALLLPGHNEEIIIATTIQSAINAGQDAADIYVVDDNSDDQTSSIARSILGPDNVLKVERSGKAVAVKKGFVAFNIEEKYHWIHVADADSVFSSDYFRIYKEKLSDDYAVAIGFVQSLRGNWISTYRAISYTYGQQVFRRIQSALGMVSVFPGPVTSFRTDILSKLDINPRNVAEDFDMTLQVHRKNMGKVLYIPKAINYTQDPQSFRDFRKQSMRWYRGFFQGIQQHQVGIHRQRIDVSIGFQLLQTGIFLLQILVLYPLIIIMTHRWMMIPIALSIDFLITGLITLWCSILLKRWYLLGAMPYFYFLRTAEIIMYFTAFAEIFIYKRVNDAAKGWSTEGRRYKIDTVALKEAAKA